MLSTFYRNMTVVFSVACIAYIVASIFLGSPLPLFLELSRLQFLTALSIISICSVIAGVRYIQFRVRARNALLYDFYMEVDRTGNQGDIWRYN